jgi:hypothetical protein
MVVITQPDWCPGCIELDRELLRNPAAAEVAELTRDWVVLEMLGYDEPDAGVIAAQGLGFLGTPTTLLLSPGRRPAPGRCAPGGRHRRLPRRLPGAAEQAAAGHDAIAAAQAQLRERNDVESLQAWRKAYLAAGDAEAARRVFQSLLLREELSPEHAPGCRAAGDRPADAARREGSSRALEELAPGSRRSRRAGTIPITFTARTWSLLVARPA